MRTLTIGIVLALAATSQSAISCTIAPLPPITGEERTAHFAQLDHDFVERMRSADAVLEVEALTTSGPNRSKARFRVLRVLKGDARVGDRLLLRTLGASLCGPGGVEKDQTGVIYLSKEDPKMFNGFIHEGDYTKMGEAGIEP
jgi:hypothetical protein